MHGIVIGNAAIVAAEVDQITRQAARAEQQAAVWDDGASKFARLSQQQAANCTSSNKPRRRHRRPCVRHTPKPSLRCAIRHSRLGPRLPDCARSPQTPTKSYSAPECSGDAVPHTAIRQPCGSGSRPVAAPSKTGTAHPGALKLSRNGLNE